MRRERRRSRPPPRVRWRFLPAAVILAIFIGLLLATIGWGLLSLSADRPILYYQATRPVRIHVMVEATADLESIRGTYAVAVAALQLLLNNPDVQAEFSTFPDDRFTTYDFDTPGIYGPAGKRQWNKVEIQTSGRVDIHMVHHDGRSNSFRAFNWEAVNVFVGDHDVTPLEAASVVLHELGHGWGLDHNPCSPIMRSEERLVFTGIAPSFSPVAGFTIDGVDVYSRAVNRTLVAPETWGVPTASLDNLVFESNDRRMTRDVYLFAPEDRRVFRQVVRTHSEDLVGESHWDSVSFSYLRVDAFLHAWSPSEMWYIAASSAGKTVEAPSSAVEC